MVAQFYGNHINEFGNDRTVLVQGLVGTEPCDHDLLGHSYNNQYGPVVGMQDTNQVIQELNGSN